MLILRFLFNPTPTSTSRIYMTSVRFARLSRHKIELVKLVLQEEFEPDQSICFAKSFSGSLNEVTCFSAEVNCIGMPGAWPEFSFHFILVQLLK